MSFQPQIASLQTLADGALLSKLRRALGDDADLHVVGGTVRDALSGEALNDIDCAVALSPDEIRARLQASGIHCVPTGLKHQTVTAVVEPGTEGIEITTFRSAGMSPKGGVRQSSSIDEDLKYRDFTINAIAYQPSSCRLIDPMNGIPDLRDRIIRAPGDARARFAEDPLRVLRMIRFSAKRGYRIDDVTAAAAGEHVPLLTQVSIERIRDELSKTLVADEPGRAFRMMSDFGILQLLFPSIAAFVGFEQNDFHKDDLFEHTLEVVERTEPELVLRLAALLHDLGKPASLSLHPETGARRFFRHESIGADMSREFLKKLRFPGAIIDEVSLLVETHMRPIEAGAPGLRRLLRDTGESFAKWRALKEADAASTKLDLDELKQRLAVFDEAIEDVRRGPEVSPLKNLAVNGNDILALGIPAGPAVGELLRALHERVLDDPELNTKEQLLALIPSLRAE